MNKKKIILIIILVIIVLVIIVFKNIQLGYNKVNIVYDEDNKIKNIELGIPKLSFMKEQNDNNYSYKNFRGNKVLMLEVKSYLNTLNKIKCNNTVYYYDKENDFTIIDYSVKNYILYNNISYAIRNGNYCFKEKMHDYYEKVGGLLRYRTFGFDFSLSPDEEFTPRLTITFIDEIDIKNEKFIATMKVEYLSPIPNVWDSVSRKELEKSSGVYEIKDNKLYYTRTSIEQKAEDIEIPETSIFEITEDKKLILMDDYLSNYGNNIILEWLVMIFDYDKSDDFEMNL